MFIGGETLYQIPFQEVLQVVGGVHHEAPPTQLEGNVSLDAGEGWEVRQLSGGAGGTLVQAQTLEQV